MKKVVCVFFSIIALFVACDYSAADKVRKPAVAGKFYPADQQRLSQAVRYYLDLARPSLGKKPVALISPHAGYIYSGQICADAFKQAEGFDYDVVVLLGTNHTASGFSKVSVYAEGGFETPLGTLRVDEDVAKKIMELSPDASFVEYVHQQEHSIEVLAPFVREMFPEAKIVPAIVGTPDFEACARFGEALAKALSSFEDRNALIVASSDLSHYPSYRDALEVDGAVLDAIEQMSPAKLDETIKKQMGRNIGGLGTCACGQAPVMAAMAAAKALGAGCAKVISYANSGDAVVGSHDRVVGYGAVAFFKEGDCEDLPDQPGKTVGRQEQGGLSKIENQKLLLSLARKTIEQYLYSRTLPLPRDFDSGLAVHRGAFVTLKKHGQLRGCIGHMAEDLPLYRVVSAMAVQAAFNDRRFTPVTLSEFPELDIEISVLTPFEKVSSYEDIVVGRDGVVLEKDGKSAVFLPQVAVEQGWDRDRMLERLCAKAGLPAGSWKEGAVFRTFQAQVFGEKDSE